MLGISCVLFVGNQCQIPWCKTRFWISQLLFPPFKYASERSPEVIHDHFFLWTFLNWLTVSCNNCCPTCCILLCFPFKFRRPLSFNTSSIFGHCLDALEDCAPRLSTALFNWWKDHRCFAHFIIAAIFLSYGRYPITETNSISK